MKKKKLSEEYCLLGRKLANTLSELHFANALVEFWKDEAIKNNPKLANKEPNFCDVWIHNLFKR